MGRLPTKLGDVFAPVADCPADVMNSCIVLSTRILDRAERKECWMDGTDGAFNETSSMA